VPWLQQVNVADEKQPVPLVQQSWAEPWATVHVGGQAAQVQEPPESGTPVEAAGSTGNGRVSTEKIEEREEESRPF
jgi:hypothetical protein